MTIKVICVTKNEYQLIEPFIQFYGKIFGFENTNYIIEILNQNIKKREEKKSDDNRRILTFNNLNYLLTDVEKIKKKINGILY